MRKGWKTGYKFVGVVGRKRTSFNDQSLANDSSLVYFTKPHKGCGPLTVFAELDTAKSLENFFRDDDIVELWEVEYLPSRRRTLHYYAGMRYEMLWHHLKNFYPGSKTAEAVRLVRKVSVLKKGD